MGNVYENTVSTPGATSVSAFSFQLARTLVLQCFLPSSRQTKHLSLAPRGDFVEDKLYRQVLSLPLS